MYTAKINNLREALKGIRNHMRRIRLSIQVLTEAERESEAEGLLRQHERLNRLYAELTDKFTCLNILNY